MTLPFSSLPRQAIVTSIARGNQKEGGDGLANTCKSRNIFTLDSLLLGVSCLLVVGPEIGLIVIVALLL
jgi:hypothetical protein